MMNYAQKFNNPIISVCAYLLVGLPAVLCLWYVKAFGVDVPFWDDWGSIRSLKGVYEGTTSWLDILCSQSNEHLVGVSDLLMMWLAKCTHCDMRTEMLLGCFFLICTWILLLKIVRDRLPNEFWLAIALLPVSWLICSLRQYETLLGGFQIRILISDFFFILSIYLLDRINKHRYWFLGLGIVSGMCSTFSAGNGLLIWPLGAVQILLKHLWDKDSNKSYKPIAIWFIACSITGLYCLYCYKSAYLASNPYGLTLAFWLKHYWTVISFFIAYLVSPIIPTLNDNIANSYPDIIVSQGLAVLGIYTATVILALRQLKDLCNKLAVPLTLILYAVMSDCLTITARVVGGINQALASRYTSISCLGIIGAYLILLIITKPSLKVRVFLLGALLIPIFASAVMCTKVGIEEGKRIRIRRILLSYILLSYKQQDVGLFPSLKLPEDFKDLVSFLEANRLSVFRVRHPNLHIPTIHANRIDALHQ